MLKLLLCLSVATFIFLLIYGAIHKKVEKKNTISARIKVLNEEENVFDRKNEPRQSAKDRQRDKADIPFVERVLIPWKNAFESKLLKIAPSEIIRVIQIKLIRAGKYPKWKPVGVILVMLIMASLCGYIGFDLAGNKGMMFIQRVVAAVIGVLVGGMLPISMLNIMMQKRQKLILKQLPELLDLLCVSVQAGLTFDAAMRKIVVRMEGPLIDECRKMLDDVRMGMVRKQSLKLLADRCDIQDVSLFTTAVIQSERLGTSMATTLNNQAENMRERRRQYIKAEALKAPVKIVFPLIMFIFPALFVVVLLPAVLGLGDTGIIPNK